MGIQEKGAYVLWLTLKRAAHFEVGRLGKLTFKEGIYAYAGSAHGPGGLNARLRHHFNSSTNPHWHIDYLRMYAQPLEAWIFPGNTPDECVLADLLRSTSHKRIPAPGFGSSDCTCPTHLVYFLKKPRLNEFQKLAHQQNVPIDILCIFNIL
jgi:Uri superfamily endonuclease